MNLQKRSAVQVIIVCMFTAITFSCKKSGTEENTPACELSLSSVSGIYHLTKAEKVAFSSGDATDITSSISSCELNAAYELNLNGTATYTENASCTGSGSGTWTAGNGAVSFNFTSGNGSRINSTSLVSWNCTTLVVITSTPSTLFNYRYTLTRLSR